MTLLLANGLGSVAEDTQKASETLLQRARQLSDIRSPNAPGFRLKVTFSCTAENLETLEGSCTEVWVSGSLWRRETTVGDFRRIELRPQGGEINVGVGVNPVEFAVRPGDETVEAHGHDIANASHGTSLDGIVECYLGCNCVCGRGASRAYSHFACQL